MGWLMDLFSYDLMRNALMAGILVGILCPAIGAYLVVQRMSFLGNVVSHALLPGLAIANFLQLPLSLGAFVVGIFSTFLTAWIGVQSKIKVDTAMTMTLSSFFALGIVLLTVLRTRLNLESLLFGDILTITQSDTWLVLAIAAIVFVGIKLFYKELLYFPFDPAGAAAIGLPVQVINFGLMAAITLTIVAGIQAVGVVLVVSLMVTPSATAFLLVKELHWMMALGSLLGAVSSVIGMYASYYLDVPCGPAIALIVFVGFLLALFLSPSQGILTRYWR
ncbi:MAG TPA: metal ABC transporter permease [Candidatus Obscuribacterales bacterium]